MLANLFDRGEDAWAATGVDLRRLDMGEEGVLAMEVVNAAAAWAGPKEKGALAVALLATQLAARQGSTRVPMTELRDAIGAIAGGEHAEIIEAMVQSPGLGGMIGRAGETRPLVVDDGCLYQHRLWWLETRLAARLAERIAAPALDDADAIAKAVQEVVDQPIGVTLTAQQAAAVRSALGGRLGVVSGGPGTGKTAIVVALVRALGGLGVESIALAAPTGKAAHRMTSAAGHPAQTLHRLLGWRPDGEFRHSELSPLPYAAVIVDEASMIDLALMERLARALRPDARLILLGDAHQLPSVDAGAVLADLVALARRRGAAWATELTESHRMRPDDPSGRAVLEAARAVDQGLIHKLERRVTVAHATGRGVEIVHVETDAQLTAALDDWWKTIDARFHRLAARAYHRIASAWDPDDAVALAELLALHEQRRLLTVTRGLSTGAVAANAHLHGKLLATISTELAPDFLPGEPVMITANDHERGLYNGDQGVVVRVVDDDGAQRWRAVFRKIERSPDGSRGGELVPLPIDAVRGSLELAWAMTVHKSQGSELERVALILPREDLPLVTRELLYTALTRARRGVIVLGAWAVFERGVARTAARASGLAARIP